MDIGLVIAIAMFYYCLFMVFRILRRRSRANRLAAYDRAFILAEKEMDALWDKAVTDGDFKAMDLEMDEIIERHLREAGR